MFEPLIGWDMDLAYVFICLEIFFDSHLFLQYAEGETGAEVFDDGDPLQRGARLPRTPHPTGETMIDRLDQIQCLDPDLIWSVDPGSVRQNLPTKKEKKLTKFHGKCWMFSLGGLGPSPVG